MPDVRDELQATGNKRRNAERELAETTETLHTLIPDAVVAGIPIAEIARLAGVSRQTVYTIQEQATQRRT